MRKDKITISGLRVRGRHGVFEYERVEGQEFLVDAVLWLDTAPAAASEAPFQYLEVAQPRRVARSRPCSEVVPVLSASDMMPSHVSKETTDGLPCAVGFLRVFIRRPT